MKLWGGRFTGKENELVDKYNSSITFDSRFWRQDITGSIAHARMLGRQGIISKEESEQILSELKKIYDEIEAGTLQIDMTAEDIHSFVEATLTERIGNAGKKLHTGRSRNDQVALDMRLYCRDVAHDISDKLKDLLYTIFHIMEENTDTYMPGFTHLQKAQPITLAHHLGAYFEFFKRDRSRIEDCIERMNYSPLGSGALAGTTYPLDREMTADELGFYGPTENSIDGVADRDYVIELLADFSLIMQHLSRFSEEIIIWNSNEYRFIEISDAYSTGSSIMPQKKNPDIAELVRGKTGRVYGSLMTLLTSLKGLPLAYNKDMQEDKEAFFDALDTVSDSIVLFNGMLATLTFNKDVMAASARNGFTNATDAADYLVNNGIPFRDAHGIIGRLVLYCIDKKCALDDLTIDEFRQFSPAFNEDVYEAISLQTCVEKRNTIGAPGKLAIERMIQKCNDYLSDEIIHNDEEWL
ncbi:MAG: argininosuccinate lyase [Lachnospiraceae bacterium]|nr:argininosuccinate lyase [Lachnospiraceae bacterium]